VKNPAHSRALGLLVAAALLWSTGGVLVKWVAWPPLAIAGSRGLIAGAFLTLVSWRALRFTWSAVQLGAALCYAATTVSFVLATKLTTAANAILLQYTAPVWVVILGTVFLGEHATRLDWMTIAACFVGMALFLFDGLRLSGLDGIVIALAGGVAFAGMIVLLRRQKDGSPIESVILGNLLAFLIGLPAISTASPLATTGACALLVMGVVQLGLPYLIYARAIRHVTALEGVLIPVLEPILNPVWVMLVIGERPSPLALAGGSIVVCAVAGRAALSIRS
jgi:drug/metabolite transporter (DMT)-like permease